MRFKPVVTLSAVVGLLIGAAAAPARADDAKPEDANKPPAKWSDTLTLGGWVNAGITFNTDSPKNGLNWGQLYTDRANSLLLNQFSLFATRPLDPKATGYDFGFTLQGIYGSDARYTHDIGEFDRTFTERNQFTILEADALLHLPWLTDGGVDARVGQFPSIQSAEVIAATGNPFYSHSYIFNFGVTVKHTGILTTTHVSPLLDVYLGVDSGNQAMLPIVHVADNNGAIAGQAGIGLNLAGGNVTVLALSHFGPENPSVPGLTFNSNSVFRWYNDITTVWKVNDNLTLTTDLNYVKDDGFNAAAYGIAQYASYAINDMFTFQARGEIWRDDKGFFVAAFPNSLDAVNALEGRPNTAIPGVKATYAEITLGVNIKPPVPDVIKGFIIRPEIRYDTTLNNAKPFNSFTSDHQFTIAADFILPF